MTSVAYVASVAPEAQLAFDLDDLAGADGPVLSPPLKRNAPTGPAKLLRRLVTLGLDDGALEAAAQLVAALDQEAAA